MSMDVRFSSPYTALVVLASRKRFVSDYTYKHSIHGAWAPWCMGPMALSTICRIHYIKKFINFGVQQKMANPLQL